MKQEPKKPDSPRQQNSEIPQNKGFGAIQIRAVAGATALKPKAKPAAQQRDLPPLLRKDQFYD